MTQLNPAPVRGRRAFGPVTLPGAAVLLGVVIAAPRGHLFGRHARHASALPGGHRVAQSRGTAREARPARCPGPPLSPAPTAATGTEPVTRSRTGGNCR